MKPGDVEALNQALRGFEHLVQFDLRMSAEKISYGLSLTLANAAGAKVVLVCGDVQNLELNPSGTGFEKMVRLEITDMRGDGFDRINFSVEEMERESLFLHCADVAVQELPA